MKKYLIGCFLVLSLTSYVSAQEYRIVTTIESIVPMGIGRSRILDHQTPEDYKSLTTARTNGKKSDQGDVKREDIKIDSFEETKLLNFFSVAGINFQNGFFHSAGFLYALGGSLMDEDGNAAFAFNRNCLRARIRIFASAGRPRRPTRCPSAGALGAGR